MLHKKRLQRKAREVPLFAYLPELIEFHNAGRTEIVVSSVLGGRATNIVLDAGSDPLAASLRTAVVAQFARLIETGAPLPYTRPTWNAADVRAVDAVAFGELTVVMQRFDDVFERLREGRRLDLHFCEAAPCRDLFLKDHGLDKYCSVECERRAASARKTNAEHAKYMREYRQTPAVKRRSR